MMAVYGYARVSTAGQKKDGNSLEAQREQLIAAGATKIYTDAYTGKVTDRPELNKLLKKIQPGDKIIVTKLDRVARSITQGEALIDKLINDGITVQILNMGTLDNSAGGKLMRQVFLAFAEFERSMILERTSEGKALAKQKPGFHEGRPKTDKTRLDHAMQLLKDNSYSQVSAMTGISVSTLTREKRRRRII